MNSKLLSIETVGKRTGARRLSFEGEWERITSKAVLRELKITEETATSPRELDAAIDEVEFEVAKVQAFGMLARKAYTVGELKDKLYNAGFPSSVIDATCARIEELGYINDEAYVRSFIEVKHAAGWGKRKIVDTLLRKHISQYSIEDALAEMDFEGFDKESQVESALRLISKRPCSTKKEEDRIVRNLVSRGFSLDCAYSAVRIHLQNSL